MLIYRNINSATLAEVCSLNSLIPLNLESDSRGPQQSMEEPITRYQKQWQSKGIPSNRAELIKLPRSTYQNEVK